MNKNDEDGQHPKGPQRGAGSKVKKPLRDIHEAQLEDLLAQIYSAAEDLFRESAILGHDRDMQIEVYQQAASMAKTYGQLVSVSDRHRKVLKEET